MRILDVSILSLLLFALLLGIAPNIDTRAVATIEGLWPGYAAELRADPEPPSCDIPSLTALRAGCSTGAASEEAADPFAAPAGPEKPSCAAVENSIAECERSTTRYRDNSARITPILKLIRSFELLLHDLARLPYQKHMLVLLTVLGGLKATLDRRQISLREPSSAPEIRFAEGMSLLAALAWAASCLADLYVQQTSSAAPENPALPALWIAGFGALAALHARRLIAPGPVSAQGSPGFLRLLMVAPLYTYMALAAALWFFLAERHPSGQAIFLHRFVQIPHVYMGIGLYIWSGMLLAQTGIARRFFSAFHPLKLPPALLGWLIITLSALPVAYSGASGVFVIATSAVVFEQMRAAGASRRLSVAVAAMSGSLGVVLRPCLVVVLISILDNQVTTDEIYGWGIYVFLLTSALSLLALLAWGRQRPVMPDLSALPEILRSLRPLLPHAAIAAAVVALYRLLFATSLDEHSAAFVLPAVLLAVLAWDVLSQAEYGGVGLMSRVGEATRRCSAQVGALLLMMCGSIGLGGVVERSEVVEWLPRDLGSPLIAMTVIALLLVAIGMAMDELGSVVLVSVTLQPIAAANGISPVHFWMVVLVGFELGYLAPPVALNQLLVRQIVGRESHIEEIEPGDGFLSSNAHIFVPMSVLGAALLVVAYVPLLWGYFSP